jgi:cation transport ATPase
MIRAEKLAEDSRYARIMKVVHETEEQKPQLRGWVINLERGTRH